jgi:serine protease Do
MTAAALRRRGALAAATGMALVFLAACAGVAPRPAVARLPDARLKEIRDLVSGGSPLLALEALDEVSRDGPALAEADTDQLRSQAAAALGTALEKAVTDKDYAAALRLLDSAEVLGDAGLTRGVSPAALLTGLAEAQSARGDTVLALLTRLRLLGLPGAADADYAAALAAATAAGNRAAQRALVAALKARSMAVPAELVASLDAPPSFTRMIAGTVTILVNKGIKVENGVGYPDRVIGSGFFIDPRGYIVTNHHVIASEVDPTYEGYSRLSIRLSESPAGEKIPARVIGWDTTLDLALIKAELTPSWTFGGYAEETLEPGDHIFAIGSPAGLEKTITSGIISAMGRRLTQVGDSMQVDVPLNPGNSGGPLLNERGDLIGIVFAGLQQYEGLNFAVPYPWVERALPSLFKGGKVVHSWLGMAVSKEEKGLEVVYVVPDEPAARAGVKVGDLLESMNGTPLRTLADAQEAVLALDQPTLVRVGLRRGAAAVSALLCAGARPDSPIETALKRDARDAVIFPLFGMQLDPIGTFLWKGNYVVKRISRGSVADESGISVDDPVTIQDWKVDTDKGFATLQVVIKKKRAGFLESAIQISTYLETDNFI